MTSASNDTDWTLVLVLRDKPNEAGPGTVAVWWRNGGACSSGAVSGQIFATGSITVPIAVDEQGVTFTVPKVAGSVSHTFVSGDLLCLSISSTGTERDHDIHAYANVASTSGTPGVTRLVGPFTQ